MGNPVARKMKDLILEHLATKNTPVRGIRIDRETEMEIAALTPEDVGAEVYGEIFRHGPRALGTLFGLYTTWDAERLELT